MARVNLDGKIKAALRRLEDVERRLAECEAEEARVRAESDVKRRKLADLYSAYIAAGGVVEPF